MKSSQRLERYRQRLKKVTAKLSLPVQIKRVHLVIALLVVVLLGVFGIIYSHIDRPSYKATQVLYMVENFAGWPRGSWSTEYIGQGTWVVRQTFTSGLGHVWFFKEQTGEVMTAQEAERKYGVRYSPVKSPVEEEAMDARVTLNGSQLIIKNSNSYNWSRVEFFLNADYKFRLDLMERDTTYHLDLSYFVTDNGIKFDPVQQKPNILIIYAYTPQGNYYGNYCQVFKW